MITVYFRILSSGDVRVLGGADGVPEQLAQMVITEVASQVKTPGLWQADFARHADQTDVELERLGDADTAVAVVQARRFEGAVELGEVWVDGGTQPRLAVTEALASAAAYELEGLPEGDWHRLALTL